ncbi:MAG: sigma-54-dependent transcriptional regulator [Candidatus Cyclobacteriaceae bacterium M3_2C_046]
MILIIDDDIAVRSSLSFLLENAGHQTLTADRQGAALHALHHHPVKLMIMDLNYSPATTGEEGLELLQEVKDRWPLIPVILITGWGSIELAVKGMRLGAADFITKPWDNKQLLAAVKLALQLNKPEAVQTSREELDQKYDFSNIAGQDPALLKLLQTIGRIAPTEAPVLIYGESGTGKELIADALHQNSGRKAHELVKVNLGAITTSLFESEMFGHKKGAFTDARTDRTGRFQLAHQGTIFLDEIGELDLASQVKLLRVLQEKKFEPVGSSQTKHSDFRVICASNKKLEDMVKEKTFREDLFYRINLISLTVPPLRERQEDIPLLANHFLNQMKSLKPDQPVRISSKALHWLQLQSWPGNIRELKNKVERASLLASGPELDLKDFTDQKVISGPDQGAIHQSEVPAPGQMTLEQMEKTMIENALAQYPDNMSQVARSLGIQRGQLYRRLEKYHLGPYREEK